MKGLFGCDSVTRHTESVSGSGSDFSMYLWVLLLCTQLQSQAVYFKFLPRSESLKLNEKIFSRICLHGAYKTKRPSSTLLIWL